MSNGLLMADEMDDQPAVIGRLVARREELIGAVRAVLPVAPVRVAIVARGSSDHAAVYGRYLLELAAGTPVALTAPSLLTRYGVATDYRGFLAIAVSQSGRTPEIVTVLEQMRAHGAATIAITNDAGSPLAHCADLAIELAAGEERAIPATKTVSAQLAAFALIAEAVGPVPWAPAGWSAVVPAVDAILHDPGPARRAAEQIGDAAGLIAIARGFLLSAALETALKLKETTGLLAQGYSAADFRHGPIAVVEPGVPVLALSAAGPCAEDVATTADDIRARGGRVIAIADQEDAELPFAADVPEALAAIPAVVRGQQLAHALALHRGVDPDAPAGLAKVTATR